MPSKLKTRCRHVGCPELTHNGYCDKHRGAADRRRGSARERGYDYRWEQARIQYLQDNPLCAECGRNGKVTAATVVDHIEDHKGNHELFWDRKNWQALCKQCHDRKTMIQNGAKG
jgi:5-methylcytosine-specific restriction protein A